MFKRRTLFVVGAGASHEAGLPCGAGLALEISNKLDIRFEGFSDHVGHGDVGLFNSIASASGEHHQFQQAAWLIRDGIHLSNSIDDFLDLHRDNARAVLYGKAAIAKCILEAERNSSLHFDDSNIYNTINFPGLHATWFAKFVKTLAKGIPREDAHTIFENVGFVVFNYDRCLEFFLHHALRRLYGMEERDAASICDELTIIRPYGVVAPLRISSGTGVLFGGSQQNCARLAPNIKTYTEQVLAADVLAEIRNEVERAECIVFLGCAFHEQNLLMLLPDRPLKIKPVFCTAFGISNDDAENIKSRIAVMFDGNNRSIQFRNTMKCADLFDNFSTSIAG